MAKILAVDDSSSIRNLIKRTLEAHGHEVTVAEDGTDALEIARKESFDLILTDVNMPKMTGNTLVRKLRLLANHENTPIIMVTTEDQDYQKQKSKNLGANGWLQKPFTSERLLNVVDVMMSKYSKAS